jgi:hypothetical protein
VSTPFQKGPGGGRGNIDGNCTLTDGKVKFDSSAGSVIL